MGRADLTRGGFYAHFLNKDALVAEVCGYGLNDATARLKARIARSPTGGELDTVLKHYLDEDHRDNAATGCVLPALAAEVAREPLPVRNAFTEAFRDYAAALATSLPAGADCSRGESRLVRPRLRQRTNARLTGRPDLSMPQRPDRAIGGHEGKEQWSPDLSAAGCTTPGS